jgi:hypothetical protein
MAARGTQKEAFPFFLDVFMRTLMGSRPVSRADDVVDRRDHRGRAVYSNYVEQTAQGSLTGLLSKRRRAHSDDINV